MRLQKFIEKKLKQETIYSDTTVIVQTESGETISALTAEELLESESDCLSMDVSDDEFDDDENLVVVVE